MSFGIHRRDTEFRFVAKFGENRPLRSCQKVVWITTQNNSAPRDSSQPPILPKKRPIAPKIPWTLSSLDLSVSTYTEFGPDRLRFIGLTPERLIFQLKKYKKAQNVIFHPSVCPPRSPQWVDLYQIWIRGSYRGHNQLCRIFFAVGSGVSILWGSKFAICHWLRRSPLTQCWRYRAACDIIVYLLSCDRARPWATSARWPHPSTLDGIGNTEYAGSRGTEQLKEIQRFVCTARRYLQFDVVEIPRGRRCREACV